MIKLVFATRWFLISVCLFLPGSILAQGFTDVTIETGTSNPHNIEGIVDIQNIGTGAAWFDYDNDGLLDLYVTNRVGANRLFKNNGDGTFTDNAIALNADDSAGDGAGVAVADYNNDGYTDIYLANANQDALLLNDGGNGFIDVTESANLLGTGAHRRGTSASWGDYDKDGFLDLYVTHHLTLAPGDEDADHQDFLYHNNGDGTFTDVSDLLEWEDIIGHGFIGGWTDYDQDGDMDIILINDCSDEPAPNNFPTRVFRNDGGSDPVSDWTFTESSTTSGLIDCRNGMGIGLGDFDRSGDIDLFYTNIGDVVLFSCEDGQFVDISTEAGVNSQGEEQWSWGSSFFDYDLDGWLDLYVAFGEMFFENNDLHQNQFYRNNGDGTFTEMAESLNLNDNRKSRTFVLGDYDLDGDQDIYIVNYGEEASLMRNDNNNGNNYINISLVGYQSNRDALGSKITVTTPGGVSHFFETKSGSNLGGTNSISTTVGLADNTIISEITVEFLSGISRTFTNIAANQNIIVHELNQEASFEDVTEISGITTPHDGEEVVDFIEIGTGAAWFDYNNDGNLDLYMTMRTGANMLYENNGNGFFTDVADAKGAADEDHDGAGVVIGDFNNDGFKDIFLANSDEDVLLKNNNGTGFIDITSSCGIDTDDRRGTSGSWGDYNKDGFLDLYIAHHRPVDVNNYPDEAVQDFLYLNNGDETFTDVSNLLDFADLIGHGFIAGWSDFDNDNDLDIILINDCGAGTGTLLPTKIFRNDGGTDPVTNWTFTEVSISVGIDDCRNGMGIAVGDYDRSGLFDVAYTNIGEIALWQNTGGNFTNTTTEAGVGGQDELFYSWGTSFFDYDLDGWQDLIVAFGALSFTAEEEPRPNQLFKNNQDNTFTDVSGEANMADPDKTRSMIHGDYDNDGDMDVFVCNYGSLPILKRNDLNNGNNFLTIKPIGTVSNRDGLGTKVKITLPNGEIQHFEVRSGSNLGGGDQIGAFFGLGSFNTVTTVEVTFLSGVTIVLNNVAANQVIEVFELFQWTGAVSSSWSDSDNWSSENIPDENTNVNIPANVPNFPVVDLNTTIKSIQLEQNASLLVDDGFTLTINGQLDDIITLSANGGYYQ